MDYLSKGDHNPMSALPAALAECRALHAKLGAIVTAIEELIHSDPLPPPPVEVAPAPKALTPGKRPPAAGKASTPAAPPTCVTCGVALVYRTGRRPTRCRAHGGKAEPLGAASSGTASTKTDRKPGPCYACNMSRRSSPCEHCGAR